MPTFGKTSMSRLNTCVRDIQTIFLEVVKHRDCMIVEGNRTAETQNSHWEKGRKLKSDSLDPMISDNWEIIDKSLIVTYKDGYTKKSKHQEYPSKAVDVVPYPELWADEDAIHEFRGVVNTIQDRLFLEGKITSKLANGYDLWDGWDLPHWQVK